MISTVWVSYFQLDAHLYSYGDRTFYQSTHVNHPCTRWAAKSYHNFIWLTQLGQALCNEYTYRYEKQHKSIWIFEEATKVNRPFLIYYSNLLGMDKDTRITFRPQCMPDIYKDEHDCRSAYRNYYLGEKTHLLKYTRRHIPDWIACMGLGEHR